MKPDDRHLDDRDLLRCLDGEQRSPEHLTHCWTCRSRLRELEELTGAIVQLRESFLLPECDDAPGPGAWLSRVAEEPKRRPVRWPAVAGLAASLAILALVWPFDHTSASAALRHSIDQEQALTAGVARPVVRQALRIRRITREHVSETDYVSWFDMPSGRWHTEGGDPALLSEVADAWRAHRLRIELPLSARAFSSAFGEDALDFEAGLLTARSGNGARAGMRLRSSDWHVTATTLELGDRRYEISEAALEVNAFTARHEGVFAKPLPVSPEREKPVLTATVAPVPVTPLPEIVRNEAPDASLDALEVDVWQAIHRGGCPSGCDVEIREEGGRIVVSGTPASEKQRLLLVNTLRDLDSSGRIVVRMNAPGQTTASRRTPDRRTRLEAVPLPIEAFLKDTSDGESRITVAALANSVISLADRAEANSRQLQRLLIAFPPERYARLPLRSQWLLDSMALENVQALRLAIAELQTLQQPIFAQLPDGMGTAPAATDLASDFASIHALLHALYAGASDTAPVEGVRELAARLAALNESLATESFNQPFRSPRR